MITSLKYKIVDVALSLEKIFQNIIKNNHNNKKNNHLSSSCNQKLITFRQNKFSEESNIFEIIEYISVCS